MFREVLRSQICMYVFGPPVTASHKSGSGSGSVSFHHQAKMAREKPWFLLFCDFLMTFYLRRMMYMYQFSGSVCFLGLPDPHPLVRGTDPRIRIRTNMSRISNTGFKITCWRITSGIRTGRRFRGGFCLVRYILEKIHRLRLFSFNGWKHFHSFLTRLLMETRGSAPFMYRYMSAFAFAKVSNVHNETCPGSSGHEFSAKPKISKKKQKNFNAQIFFKKSLSK